MLKNASRRLWNYFGRSWNYIISCFRPKKPKTEHQPTSEEEVVNNDNDSESKSHKVEESETIKSNNVEENREKVDGLKKKSVQMEDSNISKISTDSNLSTNSMSRTASNSSLSNVSSSELSASGRSKSCSSLATFNNQKNLDNQGRSQSFPAVLDTNNYTKNRSEEWKKTQKENDRKVSENKNKMLSEDEIKSKATLEKSKERQKEAEERRQQNTKRIKEKARNTQKRNSSGDRLRAVVALNQAYHALALLHLLKVTKFVDLTSN